MNPNDSPERQGSRSAWNPSESDRRYRRRLREVLGINTAGIEVILRLRNQVIALQTRVRQLESEMTVWEAGHNTRLTQDRKACWEASWQEVAESEERR